MRITASVLAFSCLALTLCRTPASAGVGDPQVRTDHPWYPGELSCSTFERLFRTQAELYNRVTGRAVTTDEDRALASWYWRNLNYWHGEPGAEDCFAKGFAQGEGNRDYWTGLFAHGFALCGTTHSQWTAELNALLGHCRSRTVGVPGHNSFEVYLTGGPYGAGRWALLDHDISTVIFEPGGGRLLSIGEIVPQVQTLKDPAFKPDRQRGWRVSGLHDDDAGIYTGFQTVEYLSGYAGPPPMVHLRRGESLRRYLKPGLEDGRTFVFWGRNYNTAGVPGPERSRTWVNQPEKMFRSQAGTGHVDGQARYANAVYTYAPDFAGGGYKEGVIEEKPGQLTFEFYTPYVIGATPPNDQPWGVYAAGGRNGLVLHVGGTAPPACPVSVSIDQGKTWQAVGELRNRLDLTDRVKGRRQYWLRFGAGAAALRDAKLSWRTVCQTSSSVLPRLKDGGSRVSFLASGRALVSAGPEAAQAEAHVVDGRIGSDKVMLELAPPRGERAVAVYGAAWQTSGNPPRPAKYQIEFSTDGGRTWSPVVKDWEIVRRPPEPGDFWSQSFCWGDVALPAEVAGPVRVRFHNDGAVGYRTVEAHLAYQPRDPRPTRVTFAWREGDAAAAGPVKTASHVYAARPGQEDRSWTVPTGKAVQTVWVDYACE